MLKLPRVFIPLFTFCILFTGCIDIIENLVLNKDGSGKYSITIDMGDMMKDPMMSGMMSADENNPFKNMDSVVYFKDLPDSVIKDNPDLWKRVSMHIFANEKDKAFYTTIRFDFKNVGEIEYVSKNIDKVLETTKKNPLTAEMGGGSSPTGMLTGITSYMLSGGELTRTSAQVKQGDEETQDLSMMKTFLGGASHKINFELPGKVRKVTIPNARIDGKKVTVEASFIDLLEKKVSLDGMIKYK